MSQDAKTILPFATTEYVMRHVDAAVNFVRKRLEGRKHVEVKLRARLRIGRYSGWIVVNHASDETRTGFFEP